MNKAIASLVFLVLSTLFWFWEIFLNPAEFDVGRYGAQPIFGGLVIGYVAYVHIHCVEYHEVKKKQIEDKIEYDFACN